jgi:hypothetical protein
MGNVDDDARDDSDDEYEFTDDEDGFVIMTLAVTVTENSR